ncbi:MAG TPA: cytidine deaminase [Kiritimatiellia bacterium]|nr:MAG: Cytidine deaminase [Verrucomicrobia bacterium ADurb.Bin070]HPO37894.1 cytidine deaminase [Kiritimatiellia bacterium]HQQ90819.1 cytidine deaminase [Kiritimatiellia bacterium]
MTLDTQMRRTLIAAAREAAARAYCPYSNYPVGAALLTRDGRIVTGCNVENVSFGLTLCAERTALVKAVSDGLCGFAALAVAGGDRTAAAPCGACRQVLAEFCAPEMPVFYARLTGGRCVATTVGALLPQAFTKN